MKITTSKGTGRPMRSTTILCCCGCAINIEATDLHDQGLQLSAKLTLQRAVRASADRGPDRRFVNLVLSNSPKQIRQIEIEHQISERIGLVEQPREVYRHRGILRDQFINIDRAVLAVPPILIARVGWAAERRAAVHATAPAQLHRHILTPAALPGPGATALMKLECAEQ